MGELVIRDRELRDLARCAEAQGWTVELSGRGHLRFVAPDGARFTTSRTPSDWRAVRNARGTLRRLGLQV